MEILFGPGGEMKYRLPNIEVDYDFDQAILRYGEDKDKFLKACEPIQDPNLCVALVANGKIQTHRLLLNENDKKPVKVSFIKTDEVKTLALPGKSAIAIITAEGCNRELIRTLVKDVLSGEADRRDHLHVATVCEIDSAGWVTYYAPLQLEGKVLHVRLVAKRTIESGEEPTEEDALKLASVFTKVV